MNDTKWQSASDTDGNSTREFIIECSDHRTVTGALWLPQDPLRSDTLMLFGHGASGDRYQAPICHLAKRFITEAHVAVLSLDGPVHGLRQVAAGGRQAFGAEYQRAACIDDMVTDWNIALHEVKGLADLEIQQLAHFGLSMGSIFGIPLIAARNDVTVATLGLVGVTGAATTHAERLLRDAGKITCPLLFLMQLEDELFDRAGYLKVFDRFPSKNKRLHANPGLHPEIPAEEIRFAFDFLRSNIEGGVEHRIIDPLAK